MSDSREIMGMLENINLLRRLFVRRASEKSKLHFAQTAIMKIIEENENCTQIEVAEILGVTPASVATSAKRLEKAGLIRRTVDEENQRCKRLSLTDEGRTAIENHNSIFKEYDELVFCGFSPQERSELMGYLERIAMKMREIEGIEGDFSSPVELLLVLRKKLEESERKV